MFFEDLFGGGGPMPQRARKPVDNSKYYEILGVPKDASQSDITKAYRNLARTSHPDKGGDPDKFKEIVKAYDTLSDRDKREKYDEYGEDAEQMGDGPMGGMFSRERRRAKADNITHPMNVTLEECFKGTTKRLKVNRDTICTSCKGAGGKSKTRCGSCNGRGVTVQIRQIGPGMIQQMQGKCGKCDGKGSVVPPADRCGKCDGAGLLKEAKVLEAVVERGMKHQDRIVFMGEGEQEPDAEPGDVVVLLRVMPHPLFQRQGAHLFMKKSISLSDALTGFELKIPHLDDRLLIVKTKPGKVTKPGQLRVIRNEGMPHRRNPFRRGHLYIEFDVEFPDSFDAKQVELLKAVFGKQDKVLPPEPKSAPPTTPKAPVASPAGAASSSSSSSAPAPASGKAAQKKKKKSKKKLAAGASPAAAATTTTATAAKADAKHPGKAQDKDNEKNKHKDGEEDHGPEEVELDDVDVDIERSMWRREKEEEQERRAAEEEDDDHHPRAAQCATH